MGPILTDLQKAVDRLAEVLALEGTEIVRDSAIKRFEICFDLAWKTIKNYAKEQGVECYSPRECLKTAFQLGLIEHEEGWLHILEDRNKTAHIYALLLAEEIYSRLPKHLDLLQGLYRQLELKG